MKCICGKYSKGKYCPDCGRSLGIKKRRPNGAGTVYKLQGNRRRPWIAEITLSWTEEGKRKPQIIGYYETEEEAENALILNRVNPLSSKANMTWGETYEEWSAIKYKKIKDKTVESYKGAWKYLSKLKKMKCRDVRTSHLQKIIDQQSKRLGRSALSKIKTLATLLFKYAIREDIVVSEKNYGSLIELPKAEKKEKVLFTQKHYDILFANAHIEWVDTILIMLYTGFRISEFVSLLKDHVYLDKRLIIGGGKTEAGTDRIVPIHSKIYNFVEKWYSKEGKTLIHKKDGSKISGNYYRKYIYYPTLEKLKIPQLVPHTTRHTFITRLNDAGVDPKTIAKIVGHTDVNFMLNTYAHKNIEELTNAIEKL